MTVKKKLGSNTPCFDIPTVYQKLSIAHVQSTHVPSLTNIYPHPASYEPQPAHEQPHAVADHPLPITDRPIGDLIRRQFFEIMENFENKLFKPS